MNKIEHLLLKVLFLCLKISIEDQLKKQSDRKLRIKVKKHLVEKKIEDNKYDIL